MPHWVPGAYCIWEPERFLYVGIAGCQLAKSPLPGKKKGLWDRLNSHAGGRRSGDQFCVYVFDRLVLPKLSSMEIAEAEAGRLLLDNKVRQYIRAFCSYSFVSTDNFSVASKVEVHIRRGQPFGLPLLNPI